MVKRYVVDWSIGLLSVAFGEEGGGGGTLLWFYVLLVTCDCIAHCRSYFWEVFYIVLVVLCICVCVCTVHMCPSSCDH